MSERGAQSNESNAELDAEELEHIRRLMSHRDETAQLVLKIKPWDCSLCESIARKLDAIDQTGRITDIGR